jgi:ATP-binding cassette subfamily B protein
VSVHDENVVGKAWDGLVVRRLSGWARPHWRLFAASFAVLLGLFALDLLGPWMWRHILDGPVAEAVAARGAGGDSTIHVREFWWWIGGYGLLVVAQVALRHLEVSQLNRTGQAVIADLREALYGHIQALDLSFHDRRPTGALVTRVTSDVENLNEMFTSGIITLLFDSLKVVVLLVAIFLLDWRLALVVAAGTPVLVGISIGFRGGARNAHRAVRAELARLNGYLQEVLQGIRVVQVFRRERQVGERFAGRLSTYLAANLRTIFLFALFFPAIDFAVSIIQGGTLWVGGLSIAEGRMSMGEFVQFWFYVALLVSPIRELGERYNILQSAFASAERIFDVLDTRAKVVGPAKSPRDAWTGRIRFEGVSFGYDGSTMVLEDADFEIAPGRTTALVGATGSGKSTLVNLLLRFYDPSAGRITLDGVDLRDIPLDALHARMGLVLQEDFLFSGTVRDNLVMGRAGVDDAALREAMRASHADEVVARLPGGLDAPVAERGATFSTGERQLLAIARALAARPPLVVLDEATASVDSGTEAKIEDATRKLLAGRSALVVAHRLSTVRRADEILVLHKGRIRERGRHEELLARGGLYARLHALQFSEAEVEPEH